ncbi:MAG: hypothetical protein M3Y87_10075 [Myxococcota bacterium]|nr:hypothetical protein [Myxococcota bacterium]
MSITAIVRAAGVASALACAAIALGSAACTPGSGEALGAAEAVAIAGEHAEDVDSFERWALRIAAADTTFPSRAAIEEAAFAPVRGQTGIEGAWIERAGPDPWRLAHPRRASLPNDLAWRRARLTGLHEYEVARAGTLRYVRARSETSGGATLVVTLAFEPDDAAD